MAVERLEIVVRGSAEGEYPPELARLRMTVEYEGSDRIAVRDRAVGVHTELSDALSVLSEEGAVAEWSSGSVHIFSYRPHSSNDRRPALVYSTRIPVSATFEDVEKLSEFLDRWSEVDILDIGDVYWDVRPASRLDHERELRKEAVADAVAKAQAYADAVGRGPVVAARLSDPDMTDFADTPMQARAMMVTGPPGGPSLSLRPEQITIAVAVDARFVAD